MTLLLGHEKEPFRMPVDLLTRRSPYFHAILSLPGHEAATRVVHLPETSLSLFHHVALWLMNPDPRLTGKLDLPFTLDLTIFATQHGIPALLNQLLDHLRVLFTANEPAVWTPDLLHRVHAKVPADCLLRAFVPWTLATLNRPSSLFGSRTASRGPEARPESWKPVFRAHPELGYDYFQARENEWSLSNQFGLSRHDCQFHKHSFHSQTHIPVADGLFKNRKCSIMTYEPFQDMTWTPLPLEDILVPKRPSKNQKRKAAKRRSRSLPWDADRGDTVPVAYEEEISYLQDVAEEEITYLQDEAEQEILYLQERASDEDVVALEAASEVGVE